MSLQDDSDMGYLSYMLRMWLRRDSNGDPVWSASLQEPGSHRTESFGDISAMFSFLQSRLDGERLEGTTQQEQGGNPDA